jgi:hypothetical protein
MYFFFGGRWSRCVAGTQEVIQVVAEEGQRYENNRNEEAEETRNNGFLPRSGNRRMRDNEGIRQSTGDWQSDPNMKWKRHVLVRPLKDTRLKKIKENV